MDACVEPRGCLIMCEQYLSKSVSVCVLSTRVHVCIYVRCTQHLCTHQGIQGYQAHGLCSFGGNSENVFFFNPAIFASWHYWIDRQLIHNNVHLPLLFQALSWKAWARTSKVSKARLAVTVSTVVKQKNAWKNWRFSPRYRKHWSSLKQRCFFGFPLLPMAFWPIAKFQMGARRFLDRPGKWLCHKVTFLPNTMRWQRTCHTLPQCFMANSLAMEALPRFTSRRQSHGCQPRGVNFYKLQLYNLYTAFLCFAVCFCMLRCSKHLCLDDVLGNFRKVE